MPLVLRTNGLSGPWGVLVIWSSARATVTGLHVEHGENYIEVDMHPNIHGFSQGP